MMYQMKKLPYNYVPDFGLQILELPYVDDELSMIILLPEEASDGSDPLLKVWRVNLFSVFFVFIVLILSWPRFRRQLYKMGFVY